MGIKELEKALSGQTPRAGTSGGSLLGSLETPPAEKKGMLMTALDWIQKPDRAISEAVGAYTEDEDPFEAALRGWEGEYKYGTLGEQLIPKAVGADYDPAEEFVKGAARLAVDIAGSPLTWLTMAPGRAAVGLGLRGAEKLGGLGVSAAKALPVVGGAVEKYGPSVHKVLSQIYLPSVGYLRKWGGRWGSTAAKSVDRMYVNSRVQTAAIEQAFKDVLKETGLAARGSKAARLEAVEWVKSGMVRKGVAHENESVNQLSQWLYKNFDEFGDIAEAYVDRASRGRKAVGFQMLIPGFKRTGKAIQKKARDLGLMSNKNAAWRDDAWKRYLDKLEPAPGWSDAQKGMYREMARKLDKLDYAFDPKNKNVWEKTFERQPFRKAQDYIPQMLNDDALLMLSTKEGFSKAVKSMARANKITETEAAEILRRFVTPQKAGNLEYARIGTIPDELLERDPLKFVPRYFEKGFNRMEFGHEFHLDGYRLSYLLQHAVNKGGLPKNWALEFRKVAMGKAPKDFLIDGLARKIMGFQVMTKMGPLSSLANLSQSGNTFIREGGTSFVKGILRSTSDEGVRAGTVAYQRGIHDALMKYAGGQNTWANKYLDYTMFNPIESMNRLLASNAGIVSTERAIRQSGGIMTKELRAMGMRTDDFIDAWRNGGKLTGDIADKIALLSSDATQHATAWKDIPLYWQKPEFRVFLQYKSFIYQQTRFLMREVMNPAIKYFKTNGKEGKIGPLVRAAATFGLGAEVVNGIRQAIRKEAGEILGVEYTPREFDEDHPLWQLFEHSMYVGGVGIAGDLVDRATKRDLAGWLLGPTLGDVKDIVEGAASWAYKRDPGDDIDMDKLYKEMERRLPFVGTLIPRGRGTQSVTKATQEKIKDALR